MSRQPPTVSSASNRPVTDTPKWGWLMVVWMALVVGLQGIVWTTGVVDHDLIKAVESGAAEVERRQLHEESDDVVRKAIQTQRDTLRFWTVIAILRDFVFGPLMLWIRTFAVATALSAVAAVSGRPVRFPSAVAQCTAWQGVWVLGLAAQVVLMLGFHRPQVETSLVLFLPKASFTAREWVALQQVDMFALVGWLGMAWSAYRRGQVHLFAGVVVCCVLAACEGYILYNASLLVNLSMRMTLFAP